MNADLAAVNNHQPLRNRSASSSSREGSRSRPDPNRYKKYLSLRNRKIVEQQYQRGLEETSSLHTASNQNIESQHEAMMIEHERPLHPILKSKSSRVSDLRYQDAGCGAGMEHCPSAEELYRQRSIEQAQASSIEQAREHSPLRVKTPSRERASAHSRSAGSRQEAHHSTLDGSKRSPIPVFQPQQDVADSEEQINVREMDSKSRNEFQSRETIDSKEKQRRNGARYSEHGAFKSTTEVDDSEFNFDFDKDGSCSYVNTTDKSERDSIRSRGLRAAKKAYYEPNSLSMAQKRLSEDRNRTRFAEIETEQVARPVEPKRSSINAYTEELREQAKQALETGPESSDPESSGYVIDYEQVLKDTAPGQVAGPRSATRYRDEMGQNTILEQTREAHESSSELESDQDCILEETERLSPTQKTAIVRDSPQQFQDTGEVHQITRRRGSRESPAISELDEHLPPYGSTDYEIGTISTGQHQEPILTFENRQTGASSALKHTGHFVPQPRQIDSQSDERSGRNKRSTVSPGSRRTHQLSSPGEQIAHEFDMMAAQSDVQLESEPAELEKPAYLKRNDLLNDDCLTPLMENSRSEYDLETTNRKLAQTNKEIDEQYEKQCYGSQPPSSQLFVTCIIRQPMDTVGIASKYKNLNAPSVTKATTRQFGMTLMKEIQPASMITSARQSHRLFKDGGINMRGSKGNSLGPSGSRLGAGYLNKSTNGLDISKSSAYSRNRSAGRMRNSSNESRGNQSAGGVNRKSSANAKKAAGAMGSIPNGYKHPHILTTLQPSRYVLRSPAGLQAQLLNILLRSEQDINHCQLAFDEHGVQGKMKGHKTMKTFEFDNCVGETKGHSLSLGLDQNIRWIAQSQRNLQSVQTQKGGNSSPPKNVIFIFGQTDALKTQLLNVMQSNSMISQCLSAKDIRFLRVSAYYLGQEYLLAHKSFGNKQQMRREIGMEIREAFRERDLNAKKIALKLSTFSKTIRAEEVKKGSHLIVQLDDLVIVELADIDNLKDQTMAKKISADFAVVTNAILSMSPYYKEHDFGKVEEDRLAPYRELSTLRAGSVSFKSQILHLVSRKSRVLLLCCVIQCSLAGTQAVDYCHKIRSYFHGAAEEPETQTGSPSRRMQQVRGDVSMDTDQNVNAFKQLGGLISEVSKARLFIDKVFATKARGTSESIKRSRNQLKQMVACLRDDVSDLLNSLAANNEGYIAQLHKIREMLQAEIYYMREKVMAMRSLGRKNSIGGSSHKSGHAFCLLPKASLIYHQPQTQPTGQKTQQKQIMTKQSSNGNLHHQQQRPRSQSSLHEYNQQSSVRRGCPQSSRNASGQRLPYQHNFQPRRNSQSHTKSRSQSRPGTATKQSQIVIHGNFMPMYNQHAEAAFTGVHSGSKRRESSTTKMRKSNESLNALASAPTVNVQSTQLSQRSQRQQSKQSARICSSRQSGSRNRQRNTADDSTNGNSNTMLGHTYTSGSHQKERDQIYRKGQAGVETTESARASLKMRIGGRNSQQIELHAMKVLSEPGKQTISTLRQDPQLTSGVKNSISGNLESTARQEAAWQQEVLELKDQLKQAIAFGEDQAKKRKKAEQNCIMLTKDLKVANTKLNDLEDRILAKDQIIHSLESQVDFLKSKLDEVKHSTLSEAPVARKPPTHELETLKQEKAQTDQVNNEILGQIGMLKEALSTFQNQELTNQKLLLQQSAKDREMDQLKQQVQQLMEMNGATKPYAEDDSMRQKLDELEHVKEKYREEAIQLRQQMRHQRKRSGDRVTSKDCNRSVSSNKREHLHLHSKIANENMRQGPAQSQQLQSTERMPQQKSLNTIKSMIRDFKEQRKGLLRTTSSREALSHASKASYKRATNASTQPQQPMPRQRSSRSREIEDREPVRHRTCAGYAQLSSHFR